MLYIFAGFPGRNKLPEELSLNVDGLNHCIEEVENLAIIEHDPSILYSKGGIFSFIDNKAGEFLYPIEYRISDMCVRDGITWDWFGKNHDFGNGIATHLTYASPEYKTVVQGTELTLNEFLTKHGTTKLADLEMERLHIKHEGWKEYEARWLPGTCPQEAHVVSLTWLVTTHKLPEFVYERIRDLIEYSAEPKDLYRYVDKHFSTATIYDGAPAHTCLAQI